MTEQQKLVAIKSRIDQYYLDLDKRMGLPVSCIQDIESILSAPSEPAETGGAERLKQRQSTRTAIANALDREAETRPPDRNRIVVPSEEEIRQMFRNKSNCYADTWVRMGRKMLEGDVIQAMTEDAVIELIRTLNPGAEVVESD